MAISRRAKWSRCPHIIGTMLNLDLRDDETVALVRELTDITGNDRYPLSPRIQTLAAILAKLRPEPAREPLPPRGYQVRTALVSRYTGCHVLDFSVLY